MSEQLKILTEFYNNNKDNKLILSKEEIKQKMKKWLSTSEYSHYKNEYDKYYDEIIFGLDDGLCFTGKGVGFRENKFTFSEINYSIDIIRVHPVFEYSIKDGSVKLSLLSNLKKREELLINIKTKLLDPIKKIEVERAEYDERQRIIAEQDKEDKRLIHLSHSKSQLINELDKDRNGTIDIIEGDDFNLLIKKHQRKIIELERNDKIQYTKQFIKLSNFINNRKEDIQDLYTSIYKIQDHNSLNEYIKIIKNTIHSYEVLLVNSISMVCFLLEDDLFNFYTIYEKLDKLNIFNSHAETQLLNKLSNIEDKLDAVIYSIDAMNNSIVMELGMLSMDIENSTDILSTHLKEIESSIDINTVVTGIKLFQRI
ncbi:MAG: hypothetical protein CMD02_06385 [Flavobacteriales bacterium]|nr:hypothetical protein [Flavobacteriales bacterium]|tara:strand:- start:19104 stop:20210 length:1107 start_codon:yes stop_codon:yes gene_type:complete